MLLNRPEETREFDGVLRLVRHGTRMNVKSYTKLQVKRRTENGLRIEEEESVLHIHVHVRVHNIF